MLTTCRAVRIIHTMQKFSRYAGPVVWALILVFLTGLWGCRTYPAGQLAPPDELPAEFSRRGDAVTLQWWESFQDPVLNDLIRRTLSDNLELKSAWARVKQALALAGQVEAARWPQVSAQMEAGRSRSSVPSVTGDGTEAVYANRYAATAAAAYEVDLWGRLAALEQAAQLDAVAVRSDMASIAVSLSALMAETWYRLIAQQALLALVREQLETNRTFLELVRLRFAHGLVPALDVYQQRQLVAANEARIPLLSSRYQVLLHQMAVLMGRPPGEPVVVVPAELPSLPPLPDPGIPSDLLRNRPDILAAWQRVNSADYRIAAAVAERFPALRLSASSGYRAADIADLLDTLIWDIAANLSQSLFDAGAEAAEVRRTRAILEERLASYTQTTLMAFQEVEDALVREAFQIDYLEKLEQQIESARQAFEESMSRYRNGLTDYLPVLTALRSLQSLEQEQITAQRDLILFRVALCRALGGAWVRESDALNINRYPE